MFLDFKKNEREKRKDRNFLDNRHMRKKSCFLLVRRPPVYDLNPLTDAGFNLMIRKRLVVFRLSLQVVAYLWFTDNCWGDVS